MQNKLNQLINICLEKNIPFVSFRLPNESKIETWVQLSGRFNFVEQFDEIANQSGFVYTPFHRRNNFPIVFFEPELILANDKIEDFLIEEISKKESLYPEIIYDLPLEISQQEYLNQAKSIIDSLDKDFPKAVLSRVQIESRPENFNAGEFFIKLQQTYPNAFCHLINIPGAGTWAGASPETLLRIDKNIAQTISLAGTQAFQNKDQTIVWPEKDLAEQQIVTDYIEGVLNKFDISDYKKEKVRNLQAGSAIHLASKFNFDKDNIEKKLGDFISAFHPTPAVCGFPKERALDLIFQIEKHNREYYSGFCGPINMNEKTDLFVSLRCMKILKDNLALFVGGGLTAKSEPENEWAETVLKAETILSIL